MRHIYRARPVDLLKSRRAGEKEPKAKWILAVIGVICLAAGYYIAVTTDNPMAAIAMFFIAVVLVIVGTYLVFTAGSIALLKLLKKNKGYYYKTKHFVSISAMMYRMKKNAVGLANICILSTMVLVIISTTLSMYLGVNDALKQRYPAEYNITCMAQDNDYFDQGLKALRDNARSEGLTLTHEIAYRDFSFSAIYEKSKDFFVTDPSLYSNFLCHAEVQPANHLRGRAAGRLQQIHGDKRDAWGKRGAGLFQPAGASDRHHQRVQSVPPRKKRHCRTLWPMETPLPRSLPGII